MPGYAKISDLTESYQLTDGKSEVYIWTGREGGGAVVGYVPLCIFVRK